MQTQQDVIWILPGDTAGNPLYPIPEELKNQPFIHYLAVIPPLVAKISESEFYDAVRKLLALLAKNSDCRFVFHEQFSLLHKSNNVTIVQWYNYVFLPKVRILAREYPQIELPNFEELSKKLFFAYIDVRGKTNTVLYNSEGTYHAYLKSSLVVKLTKSFSAKTLEEAKQKIADNKIPFEITGGYKEVAI